MIFCIERNETVDVPMTITCDICQETYDFDSLEAQEFHMVRHESGYNSVFGDGNYISLDICQHCLKKIIGKYL